MHGGRDTIPTPFLGRAAEILSGHFSGASIVRITSEFAADYDRDIPHAIVPFNAPNKRTALFENLRAFDPPQQYQIIREMCDRVTPGAAHSQVADLKITLMSRYGHLAQEAEAEELNRPLIVETRHWIDDYPEAKKLYDEALQKHSNGVFTRNALDDLRLALEKLLQSALDNARSLENQIAALGPFIKERGGSKELANMFEKLIDYFSKYQNTYVKHDDAVLGAEVDIVLELTSSFMKHIARLSRSA